LPQAYVFGKPLDVIALAQEILAGHGGFDLDFAGGILGGRGGLLGVEAWGEEEEEEEILNVLE